ncbi:hypothetical protein [Pseudovibrio ascidiaceicola]|uniref:hypothetical protein n=1 Tax=Pseudovibrio ascidiaceicola TaxID=285279 RepID=UPI000D69EBA0|nr:hypothetical protein [Pseudovibrio ascidiaceicola]
MLFETTTDNTGAFDLGEGPTPVNIWQSNHVAEPLWIASAGTEGGAENQNRIDETDLSLPQKLGSLPARRWAQMCPISAGHRSALLAFYGVKAPQNKLSMKLGLLPCLMTNLPTVKNAP